MQSSESQNQDQNPNQFHFEEHWAFSGKRVRQQNAEVMWHWLSIVQSSRSTTYMSPLTVTHAYNNTYLHNPLYCPSIDSLNLFFIYSHLHTHPARDRSREVQCCGHTLPFHNVGYMPAASVPWGLKLLGTLHHPCHGRIPRLARDTQGNQAGSRWGKEDLLTDTIPRHSSTTCCYSQKTQQEQGRISSGAPPASQLQIGIKGQNSKFLWKHFWK